MHRKYCFIVNFVVKYNSNILNPVNLTVPNSGALKNSSTFVVISVNCFKPFFFL